MDLPARIPPHNLDAERAVLGAVLLEGAGALPPVASLLQPTDFYTEAHRTVYVAMLDLGERREPVDLITVTEALRRAEQLQAIGGPAALALLVEQASIGAHVEAYAAIVRDQALLRAVIQAGTHAVAQAFDAKDDVAEVIEAAELRIRELKVRLLEAAGNGTARPLGDVMDTVVKGLEAGRPAGMIPTPYPSVNQFLAGGLVPTELVYLGGYAGFGKTAMALELTTHGARQGHPGLIVSREMMAEALGRRLLSQEAGIQASVLRSGNLTTGEWTLIHGVLPQLRGLPIWITDRVATIAQLEALVRLECERHGTRLLVVDYLQLLRGPRGIGDKRIEVEYVSGALKALAMEHQLVVVCISAMSRRERGAANRKPTMADLRETGRLEHDADIILLGHRPDPQAKEAELIIAKGRGVGTGTIPMLFFGATLTFEERSTREPGEDEAPF